MTVDLLTVISFEGDSEDCDKFKFYLFLKWLSFLIQDPHLSTENQKFGKESYNEGQDTYGMYF